MVGAAWPPVVLVCDADGTLVEQGATPDRFREAVASARARLHGLPGVAALIVVTNGPRRGAQHVIERVGKPHTGRRGLGIPLRSPLWVVGDQVLSDGVWAWRLGADRFVQLAISVGREPEDQARMRRCGERVRRLFLRPAP